MDHDRLTQQAMCRAQHEVALAAKVAFLSRPDGYPGTCSRVETVETHMSWVFLTEAHAYKLKKPVRYPYLDFSSIEARRLDCEQELRLNRRLAGDVYLGLVALSADASGHLQLGGASGIVDWLVQMRRLPAERMLDRMLPDQVSRDEMDRLARRLARFYQGLPREPITPEFYRQRLADRIEEDLVELQREAFGLPGAELDDMRRALCELLESHAGRLDSRVRQGRIVEGHGDLRPEHVCLLQEPVVIDCLEFNRGFRILDPADEIGYLALECERMHAPHAGHWLLESYLEASGDNPPGELIHFYQSSRAILRAKLAIWHLRDDGRHPPGKWVAAAQTYLELAQRHAQAASN